MDDSDEEVDVAAAGGGGDKGTVVAGGMCAWQVGRVSGSSVQANRLCAMRLTQLRALNWTGIKAHAGGMQYAAYA